MKDIEMTLAGVSVKQVNEYEVIDRPTDYEQR